MSYSNDTMNSQILAYLQEYKEITPERALDAFNCYRLSARIYDLRKAGHTIRTVRERHRARYVLIN
jgi:hypothetical protein